MSKDKENIFSTSDCLSLDVILRYLYDGSTLEERHKVEKHMLECDLCKEAVEGYALMKEKSNAAGIVADLNKGFAKKTDAFFIVRRVAAGVAAVLVLGGGLFYLNTNLHTAKDPVALQKEEPDESALRSEKFFDQVSPSEPGPVVLENGGTRVPGAERKATYKSGENKSDKKTVTEEEASGTYMWSKGNTLSSAASVPNEEGKKELHSAADTVSLKDQIAYDNAKSPTPESNNQVLKEEVLIQNSRKDEKLKKKSRSEYYAPAAAKVSDLESVEVGPGNLEIGIQEYQEKKYSKASAALEQVIKSDSLNSKALYYNGLSYFESGNWDKAIENFSRIKKGKEFYEDARWKHAMALGKKGDNTAAKEILEKISGGEGPYKQKALEELKK